MQVGAQEPSWRGDIDGLRTVAVLSVVFHHASFPGGAGGFVGVDIFFVISGYLITGLIAREQDAGRFSLASFYLRRLRRIVPALLTMLVTVAVFGIYVMTPEDLKSLAQSMAGAVLGVSNFVFNRSTDHFHGVSASVSPLLHTWSLGVEEQFYLVFPALMIATRRMRPGFRVTLFAGLALLSLALCIWETRHNATAAFYLPFFRAWEFLLGSIVALGAPRIAARFWREALGWCGLGVVALSILMLRTTMAFPGWIAIAPCVGTAAILLAGEGRAMSASRLLSLPPVRFVGRISYSLYLWHMPILICAAYMKGGPLDRVEKIAAVATAFLLATLSWALIEEPVRKRRFLRTPSRLVATLATAILALSVSSGVGYATDGLPQRLPRYVSPPTTEPASYRMGSCFLKLDQPASAWRRDQCIENPSAPTTTLLWGDAFAAGLSHGLVAHARAMNTRLILYSSNLCPPVLRADIPARPSCADFEAGALSLIQREHVNTVILSARWNRYLKKGAKPAAIEATIASLRGRGIRVVLVSAPPGFSFESPNYYEFITKRNTATVGFPRKVTDEMRAIHGEDVLFEPMAVLCKGQVCPLRSSRGYLYWDGGYLTDVGSDLIADRLVAAAF